MIFWSLSMTEIWKEIKPGSKYRVSNFGRFKYRDIVCSSDNDGNEYVWIEAQKVLLGQLVVAVFLYDDLSMCCEIEIGFKDKDRTNCSLNNLYVKDDEDGKYLGVVRAAAEVCDNIKEMLKYIDSKGYDITILQLARIKRDYKIRCGTKRKGTYTILDETKTLDDWAKSVGMLPDTLKKRLQRGWSLEKALKVPVLNSKVFRIG